MPMKDMEQASGRIRRLLAGKKEPVVIDWFDDHRFLYRLNNARLRFYRSQGWVINRHGWPRR